MGVENDKLRLFIRLLSQSDGQFIDKENCPALIDDERKQINEMVEHINKSVMETIAMRPYVSSNVLMYTIATVVCAVLKLDYDMWRYDSEPYMEHLIRRLWATAKEIKVDY